MEGWLLNDDFESLDFGAEWDDLHGEVGDGEALADGVAHEVALAGLLLASLAGVVDDDAQLGDDVGHGREEGLGGGGHSVIETLC